MAIAAGCGVRADIAAVDGRATACAFGERGGRVLVGASPERATDLEREARMADVPATRVGVADGVLFDVRFGGVSIQAPITRLAEAWGAPF
jgi:hypothetical protein